MLSVVWCLYGSSEIYASKDCVRTGSELTFLLLSSHCKHIIIRLAFRVGLQACRNAKLSGEAFKNKLKAYDIAQWIKKRQLVSQTKSDMVTIKDLKRKLAHDEKPERSIMKSLISKRHSTISGSPEFKPFDEKDGKYVSQTKRRVPPKVSTAYSGLLIY